MATRTAFNFKRKLKAAPQGAEQMAQLARLADAAIYQGNAAHKRHPTDFGLAPPFGPRLNKTLCDDAGISTKSVAIELLREGLRRGVVSRQFRGQWPQNVWAVGEAGLVLEAMLGNQELGEYHGYPMPGGDPFRVEVLARWNAQ